MFICCEHKLLCQEEAASLGRLSTPLPVPACFACTSHAMSGELTTTDASRSAHSVSPLRQRNPSPGKRVPARAPMTKAEFEEYVNTSGFHGTSARACASAAVESRLFTVRWWWWCVTRGHRALSRHHCRGVPEATGGSVRLCGGGATQTRRRALSAAATSAVHTAVRRAAGLFVVVRSGGRVHIRVFSLVVFLLFAVPRSLSIAVLYNRRTVPPPRVSSSPSACVWWVQSE